MITKVLYSKNPAATINYVMNPKKKAEIYLSKGINSLFDVPRIIKDFELQSLLHPSLEVKAIHIPMSFHVRDTSILNEHDIDILQDWIDRMESHGYHFDQFLIARHHDKDHKNPHWHMVANVVLNDGTRANLANIGEAAREASISITEKWGLTSAKHARDEMQAELQESLKDYSRQDFIEEDSINNERAITRSANDADNDFANQDLLIAPDIELPTSNVTGMIASLLLPPAAPVASCGGGGNNDDDEKKKKKRKSPNRSL